MQGIMTTPKPYSRWQKAVQIMLLTFDHLYISSIYFQVRDIK